MVTAFPDQEELVPEILLRFGEIPNEVVPTREAQQDLRSAIDLAVHFYFYLKERASEPLDINNDEIDLGFLLDLTANASSFWHVKMSTGVFQKDERIWPKWEWEQFSDLKSLTGAYFASYERLVSESTTLEERYFHLLRLAKIQLMFGGIVFI